MKKRFTKRPYLYGALILVILIILGLMFFRNGNGAEETMTITRANFLNDVSVSGKVVASQSADLGFDQSGRIASINKKVGDSVTTGTVIASIDNGTARADVIQKQAAVEREQAKLIALQRGTRPEELTISEQTYADATSALVIAMRNAFLQTEDALLSDVDDLFENGDGYNPTLDLNVGNQTRIDLLEDSRLAVTQSLKEWKNTLDSLSATSSYNTISSAHQTQLESLLVIKNLLNHLSNLIADLRPQNSGLDQTQIDSYRSMINSAGQETSTAASAEQTAYSTWISAYNQLNLDVSGSTPEDISAQAAQVKVAQADLVSSQAQLQKTLLVAPFNGTVTRIDLKVGEIVSPSASQISLMSAGTFEVESFIPEISIARVQVGNPAVITLDAYGADVSFPATIISIDPAETIRDGVSTYKTRLQFSDNDPRIKSGMTANIRITTESKPDVISIPQSIITTRDGKKFVQVKEGEAIRDVEVTTGSVSALGQIEIVSGLNEGDIVILPPLTQTP